MTDGTDSRRFAGSEPPPAGNTEGVSAHLALVGLMCGFSFTGLVLYLGMSTVSAIRVVAAALLLAAFTVLLFSAYCVAQLSVDSAESRPVDVHPWYGHSLWSTYLGMLLLLGSLCVMAFAWTPVLGWFSVSLSTLLIVAIVLAERQGIAVGL